MFVIIVAHSYISVVQISLCAVNNILLKSVHASDAKSHTNPCVRGANRPVEKPRGSTSFEEVWRGWKRLVEWFERIGELGEG